MTSTPTLLAHLLVSIFPKLCCNFWKKHLRPFQGNNHPNNETMSRGVGEKDPRFPDALIHPTLRLSDAPIPRLSDSRSWIVIFPEWPKHLMPFQAVCCAITTGHGLTRRCSVGERGAEGEERGQHIALRSPNGTCLETALQEGSLETALSTLQPFTRPMRSGSSPSASSASSAASTCASGTSAMSPRPRLKVRRISSSGTAPTC